MQGHPFTPCFTSEPYDSLQIRNGNGGLLVIGIPPDASRVTGEVGMEVGTDLGQGIGLLHRCFDGLGKWMDPWQATVPFHRDSCGLESGKMELGHR